MTGLLVAFVCSTSGEQLHPSVAKRDRLAGCFCVQHMWREENLMRNTNIVICTPGRLLHHLDQTRQFNADELQILGTAVG